MKKISIIMTMFALLFFFLSCSNESQPKGKLVQLNPAAEGDLVHTSLMGDINIDDSILGTRESRNIQFSYSLVDDSVKAQIMKKNISDEFSSVDSANAIRLARQEYSKSSVSYTLNVSVSEIQSGIELPISQKEALIRIRPLITGKSSLYNRSNVTNTITVSEELNIEIQKKGKSYTAENAYHKLLKANENKLQRDVQKFFPRGTAVFRLKQEIGIGKIKLRISNLTANIAEDYAVQVFEKGSPLHLELQASKRTFSPDEKISMRFSLQNKESDSSESIALENTQGNIISPTGKIYPAFIDAGQGKVSATVSSLDIAKDMDKIQPGKLWQLQLGGESYFKGVQVRRNIQTSFALVIPTARLTGNVYITHEDNDDISAQVEIETAMSGRYEIRGILFGKNGEGVDAPIAVSHSASTLDSGIGYIVLRFSGQDMSKSALTAPFSVKGLKLIHQNQIALLHSQQDAFTIE